MENIKQRFNSSVMNYISASLVLILSVSLLSIFISYWLTGLVDSDAQAINVSGSMRMLSYELGIEVEQENKAQLIQTIKDMDATWLHPVFNKINYQTELSPLKKAFSEARTNWEITVKPSLLIYSDNLKQEKGSEQGSRHLVLSKQKHQEQIAALKEQVKIINGLVGEFQKAAENDIYTLRAIQIIAMLAIIFIGSLIFYRLKIRVEKPLETLTKAAHKIGQGDFNQHIQIESNDELSLLSATMNNTCKSIAEMYSDLENRVNDKTKKLRLNNTTLSFLFNIAKQILEGHQNTTNYQNILDELCGIIKINDIELCLMTPEGDQAFQQFVPSKKNQQLCEKSDCSVCKGEAIFNDLIASDHDHKFPIICEGKQRGVLVVRDSNNEELLLWQKRLLESVTDQFAISLTLKSQKDQERRLTLLNERTVIARELHDSLAQALSYLQIQVTRLQKSIDLEKPELQQPIIDELRNGLSSAYRQLRELLTTFRLKVSVEGLHIALTESVEKLQERTQMTILLDYQIDDIPLSATEEIHLLQIIREGGQNAVNHSQGSQFDIQLKKDTDNTITLLLSDNGVGLPKNPEKLNHYGLAIIEERSRHLAANLTIDTDENQGTQIQVSFKPQVFKKQSASL